MTDFTEYLVDTNNPEGLDSTLQQIGACLIGGGMPGGFKKQNGHYVIRYLGGSSQYFEYVCETQGYCKLLRKLDPPEY